MAKPKGKRKSKKIETWEGVEVHVPAKLSPQHGPWPRCQVDYIVLHYAGVPGLAASTLCDRFIRTTAQKSTHYVVDESEIWRVCEDRFIAWHCGTKEGKYRHSCCRNGNSIGVDLCERRESATTSSVYAPDIYFPEKTVARAMVLCAALCRRYKLDPRRALLRHYDVTGKVCPAPWVGADIVCTHTGRARDADWKTFVERVAGCIPPTVSLEGLWQGIGDTPCKEQT